MKFSAPYRYTVDTVPMIVRPQFYLYGYGTGMFLFAFILFLRLTLQVQIFGREKLFGHSNHIFCLWHSQVPLALASTMPAIPRFLDGASQAWMQHPVWYMKPIHVLLHLMGVEKIVLGSTGHSGRQAADELVDYLQKGYSTVLNPDGPYGPAFVLKKGILHLALNSGVPIVAVRFSASSYCELKTWDRKKMPYPFSRMRVEFGDPIQVTSQNFETAAIQIEQQLHGLTDGSVNPAR